MRRFLLPGLLFMGLVLPACEKPRGQAPDFTLSSLSDSAPIHLASWYEISPVLLVFWASWCPACIEEIPAINQLRRQYHDNELKILGISVQESPADLREFIKKNPVAYPIALDEAGETAAQYKVNALPTCVLLAKGGEILYYGFTLPNPLDTLLKKRSDR